MHIKKKQTRSLTTEEPLLRPKAFVATETLSYRPLRIGTLLLQRTRCFIQERKLPQLSRNKSLQFMCYHLEQSLHLEIDEGDRAKVLRASLARTHHGSCRDLRPLSTLTFCNLSTWSTQRLTSPQKENWHLVRKCLHRANIHVSDVAKHVILTSNGEGLIWLQPPTVYGVLLVCLRDNFPALAEV